MPNYVYKDEDGIHEIIFMTFDEMRTRQFKVEGQRGEFIENDGRILKRVYVPCGTPATGWPLRSAAMGVGEDQIAEQTKYDREMGVPTEYAKNGDAIYRDANHRRKHMKLHGMIDRDSFI